MGNDASPENTETALQWTQQANNNRSFRFALIAALGVEIALVAGLVFFSEHHVTPTPKPKVISVQMVHLPPPPPPKPVVKPKPTPPKPTPPVPVVHRPAPLPIRPPVPPAPPKPVLQKPTPPAPTPPPPVTPPPVKVPPSPAPAYSGVRAYGSSARSLVKQNVHIGGLIKRMHYTGRVMVSFQLSPQGGKAENVHIVGGSGNPLIRKAALRAVENSTFPAFTSHMPPHTLTFTVPIDIS